MGIILLGLLYSVVRQFQISKLNRELAITDELTNISNRRYVIEMGNKEYLSCKRYRQIFNVMMVDVDHFKSINDTYGHNAGDKTLQLIVQLCEKEFSETDVFGRIGREEFLAILPSTNLDLVNKIADRLRQIIEQASFEKYVQTYK